MTPIRIHRKRTKGWRMPPNTVYVGRPTKWGNPFKFAGPQAYSSCPDECFETYRWCLGKFPIPGEVMELWGREGGSTAMLVALAVPVHDVIHQLRGKNLACWCAFGEPCHADVLLELANA